MDSRNRNRWNILDIDAIKDKELEFDVIVVGTGAGGAVTAAQLTSLEKSAHD